MTQWRVSRSSSGLVKTNTDSETTQVGSVQSVRHHVVILPSLFVLVSCFHPLKAYSSKADVHTSDFLFSNDRKLVVGWTT